MSALLNFPAQHSDEHLIGYLRRLALLNGYLGWRDLVRAAGFKPTKAVLENDVAAVMHAFGGSQNGARSPAELQAKPEARRHFFYRPKFEPLCVECLQESEHLHREWSHCLVVACADHSCLLIDRCPRCNEMLENTRSGIAVCNCGFDLRFATSSKASPIQCWSSARMTGDMRPFKQIAEIGGAADYGLLDSLLFQLAIRIDPRSRFGEGSAARPKTVADAIALLTPALGILEDPRPRLTEHIAFRFEAGNKKAFNLAGRLGVWYTYLDNICRKAGAFPVIWNIVSDAVLENFDGLIRGQAGLTPSPGKERQFVGVAEAAKLVGVSKPLIQSAIEQGLIQVRSHSEGINYSVHMISRLECDRVRRSRAEWLSISSAAAMLGVSKPIMEHLISAKVIVPDDSWQKSALRSGPISREQVTSLISRAMNLVQVQSAKKTLRFDEINARRTVDIKALTRLYQAIFSGEVRPIASNDGDGLAGLVFAAEDVIQYLGTAALDNALTLTQLAAVTKWKYESIAGWTKQGLLTSEIVVLQGRKSRVVTVEGLAAFRRGWIPVSEIAAAVGSKGSAVTKLLSEKGVIITGQTLEKNGASRGGLIRIADLGRLAGLVRGAS